MNQIHLKKGKSKFLDRKHPWIFSGAIASLDDELKEGEVVAIMDEKSHFCCKGIYQKGTIAIRILTFNDEKIDQAFWNKKINEAVQLRKDLGLINENHSICRLVHGEGDFLPGLIIDFYNGVAVIQAHAFGMYQQREMITTALVHVFKDDLKAVYCKSAATLPNFEVNDVYLFKHTEVPHIAKEHGYPFSINWESGQKTGFFIDQRENRKKLAHYSKGKKVLNTFCYSGGFSIYALQAGAEIVYSVDSSEKALELTAKNIKLQKFSGEHKSILADAIKYMNQLEEDYDIIVLDPPAFAKSQNKRHQAIKAYTRLNANAIRQIKSGGIIFTFSCSQVVTPELFKKAVMSAAISCGRSVRIIEQLHQPQDHPISAFHPEGEYLKGLILQVN